MPKDGQGSFSSKRCYDNYWYYVHPKNGMASLDMSGGAILHTRKVGGMCSEFNVPCGRGQGVLVASPQQEVQFTHASSFSIS